MYCRVPGCDLRALGWSRYCSAHKSRNRRHGHPSQKGITKAEVRPYLEIIEGYRERNPENPAWKALESRWGDLLVDCRSTLAAFQNGRPMVRHDVQKALELIALADAVSSVQIIDTVAAMVYLAYDQPRRILSDAAMHHQVARRVRALTAVNAGSWIDRGTGKPKRVYRDLPPKTAKRLGHQLVATFGALGLVLHGREREAAQREQARDRCLMDGIKELN